MIIYLHTWLYKRTFIRVKMWQVYTLYTFNCYMTRNEWKIKTLIGRRKIHDILRYAFRIAIRYKFSIHCDTPKTRLQSEVEWGCPNGTKYPPRQPIPNRTILPNRARVYRQTDRRTDRQKDGQVIPVSPNFVAGGIKIVEYEVSLTLLAAPHRFLQFYLVLHQLPCWEWTIQLGSEIHKIDTCVKVDYKTYKVTKLLKIRSLNWYFQWLKVCVAAGLQN